MTLASPILSIQKAVVQYGANHVLHGVAVDLAAGEFLLVAGPNGAGKSTLLRAIAGLLPLSSGRILMDGKEITHWHTAKRSRAGLGLALQGGAVFGSMTTKEHLMLAESLALGRVDPSHSRAVRGIVQHLWSRQTRVDSLSGGERQAVAIATVLAQRPRLVLCDEPTAGLAPASANALLSSVARFCREEGVAVIWVEHRTREVLPLVDRALLLMNGVTVAETDQPTEWIDGGPLLGNIFGLEPRGTS